MIAPGAHGHQVVNVIVRVAAHATYRPAARHLGNRVTHGRGCAPPALPRQLGRRP